MERRNLNIEGVFEHHLLPNNPGTDDGANSVFLVTDALFHKETRQAHESIKSGLASHGELLREVALGVLEQRLSGREA